MNQAILEHANITVSDPDKTAALLCQLFDWKVRWSGAALDGGYTVHVGGEQSYLALYTHSSQRKRQHRDHYDPDNLNHLGVVVKNLDVLKQRVNKAGLKSFNHGNYEPGQRFYFKTDDHLEIEVVNYTAVRQQHSFFELCSLQK